MGSGKYAKNSKSFTGIVCLISAIIVIAAFVTSMEPPAEKTEIGNKYNNLGYIDVDGKTVQDLADEAEMSLEEYLIANELPANMPPETIANVAENMVPIGLLAREAENKLNSMKRMCGISPNVSNFELFKLTNGLPAEVTEDMTVGEASGLKKLKYIVKDEAELAEFKKQYGLGDDITLETEYKEVRNAVDLYRKEQYEQEMAEYQQKKQQELAESQSEQTE